MVISSTCSPWMNVNCIGRVHPTSQAISPLQAASAPQAAPLIAGFFSAAIAPALQPDQKPGSGEGKSRQTPSVSMAQNPTDSCFAALFYHVPLKQSAKNRVHYILPTSLCSPSSSPQFFQVTHPMAPPAGSRPARCHRRTSQPHPGAVAEGWPSHGCPTERPTRKAMAEVQE